MKNLGRGGEGDDQENIRNMEERIGGEQSLWLNRRYIHSVVFVSNYLPRYLSSHCIITLPIPNQCSIHYHYLSSPSSPTHHQPNTIHSSSITSPYSHVLTIILASPRRYFITIPLSPSLCHPRHHHSTVPLHYHSIIVSPSLLRHHSITIL